MAGVGHNLMIKYGLPRAPSDELVAQWKTATEKLINDGYAAESSGNAAAKQIFPGYNTHVYASEADDISSLLDAAGDS